MMTTPHFTIYPAIDMKAGKVVRLLRGDMHRATEYGDDPVAQARAFYRAGASWVHLVNLDGAFQGGVGAASDSNYGQVRAIMADRAAIDRAMVENDGMDKAGTMGKDKKGSAKARLQLGGGIAKESDVAGWLGQVTARDDNGRGKKGVDRVIIGTWAVQEPAAVAAVVKRYPHMIALAVDCNNGMVASRGWVETSTMAAVDFMKQFAHLPLAAFIHTDIARDGTGAGANWQESALLVQALRAMGSAVPVIVSGGIHHIDDVRAVKNSGLFGGVIVGRAIYEKNIDLAELFALDDA